MIDFYFSLPLMLMIAIRFTPCSCRARSAGFMPRAMRFRHARLFCARASSPPDAATPLLPAFAAADYACAFRRVAIRVIAIRVDMIRHDIFRCFFIEFDATIDLPCRCCRAICRALYARTAG